MAMTARVLVGLVGLFFLVFGLRFMFMPVDMAASFFVQVQDAAGLSTVRADLGAAFLTVALMTLLGLRAGQTHWLLGSAVFLLLAIVGRLVGFAYDGVAQSAVQAAVFEAVLLAILVGAFALLRRSVR